MAGMSAYGWLHRKGIARTLNIGTRSWDDRGSAYIQACGPRWLAARLAMYALRHTTLCRPDWQTARIMTAEQPGRLCWRFQITFRRLSR
jgi:hypothetical protein